MWNQIPDSPNVDRSDGYVNMVNKYGTTRDSSAHYQFDHAGAVPDMDLTLQYEENGLFAKIIDAPAEKALEDGFDYGIKSADIISYLDKMLDKLNWIEEAATAIKWSRLYGGALCVMVIDDGRGIDEPLDVHNIRSIDEIRVYERPIVWTDYTALYNNSDYNDGIRKRVPRHNEPEYYQILSMYGQYWVHASRCLIFRNGRVPERTLNPYYRFWGIPEYLRWRNELKNTMVGHGNAAKLLDRAVQAIYKMKDLAMTLETEQGEDVVMKRLLAIDKARGILSSITIDSDGEDYDFKSMTFTGVKDIIDTGCQMLSAITNIPQTVLFGRSPAGENATGESDLENWYSYVGRLQNMMLEDNMTTLLNVIIRAGLAQGELDETPEIKLSFNPMWSLSEKEQAEVDRTAAQTQQAKATTAQMYVDLGILQPKEVRKALADEEAFTIDDILDDTDEHDLWGEGGIEGWEPDQPEPATPAETPPPLPIEDKEDKTDTILKGIKDRLMKRKAIVQRLNADSSHKGVGVLIVKDGNVLAGIRSDNGQICGAGGHIKNGETPVMAAIRETQEEFGITPMNLKEIGERIFLCTEWDGNPRCADGEITDMFWLDPNSTIADTFKDNMFPAFRESLKLLPANVGERLTKDGYTNKLKSDGEKGNPENWITMNGAHIYVAEGQTKEQAAQEFIARKENERTGAGGLDPSNPANLPKSASTPLGNSSNTTTMPGDYFSNMEELMEDADYEVEIVLEEDMSQLAADTQEYFKNELGRDITDDEAQRVTSGVLLWSSQEGCASMRSDSNPNTHPNGPVGSYNLALVGDATGMELFIESSPKWDAPMYRGVNADPSQFAVGNTIHQKGLSSWSADQSIATEFSGTGADSVVFVMNGSKRATPLGDLAVPFQSEVVLSSTSRQQVIGTRTVDGVTYVDLQEIP